MEIKALLTIGKITGAHGLGGNLKVWSFAESADTFAPGRQVWLKPEILPVKAVETDLGTPFVILKSSVRKKGMLLTLKGVDTRNRAEDLIGHEVLVHRDELPMLEEDTWYWQDLYGLKVMDEKHGDIGIIEHIFPTGANDVLVIRHQKTGKETLVPMHRHFIETVDIEGRIVHTRLPEGL